jgi:hypothetical protein
MEDILAIKEVTDQFINQNSDKHFFASYLKFMNMKVDFSFEFIVHWKSIYWTNSGTYMQGRIPKTSGIEMGSKVSHSR